MKVVKSKKVRNQFTQEERVNNTAPPPTSGNLVGERFGKLIVLGYVDHTKNEKFSKRKRHVWVKCDCGESNKLVEKGSLTRGATTSCGCNYKNNGTRTPLDKTWYQDKVKDRFHVIGDYYGYNYDVKVSCVTCGEVRVGVAKSLAFNPCTKCNLMETASLRYMKENGFTLVDYETSTYNCKHCNIDRRVTSTLGYKCPCLRDIESPVSVYLLSSPTKSYVKIGKALNPYQRVLGINRSGGDDFQIVKYWWVSGDKCAHLLESHLHKKYGGRGLLEREGFSGDTEIFDVSVEEVVAYMKSINKSIKSLRKGVVPPNLQELESRFKLPTKLQEYSFDFDGFHYPSPSSFWRGWLGLSENRYNLQGTLEFLDFHKTHNNVLNQGAWNNWGYTYSEYVELLLSTNLSHKTVSYRASKGIPYDEILKHSLEKSNWLYIDGKGYPRKSLIDKLFPSCLSLINSADCCGKDILPNLFRLVYGENVDIFIGTDYEDWELSLRGLSIGDVLDVEKREYEFNYENSLKFLNMIKGQYEHLNYKSAYVSCLACYYFNKNLRISCIKAIKQKHSKYPIVRFNGWEDRLTLIEINDQLHLLDLNRFKEINNIQYKSITLTDELIESFKHTL